MYLHLLGAAAAGVGFFVLSRGSKSSRLKSTWLRTLRTFTASEASEFMLDENLESLCCVLTGKLLAMDKNPPIDRRRRKAAYIREVTMVDKEILDVMAYERKLQSYMKELEDDIDELEKAKNSNEHDRKKGKSRSQTKRKRPMEAKWESVREQEDEAYQWAQSIIFGDNVYFRVSQNQCQSWFKTEELQRQPLALDSSLRESREVRSKVFEKVKERYARHFSIPLQQNAVLIGCFRRNGNNELVQHIGPCSCQADHAYMEFVHYQLECKTNIQSVYELAGSAESQAQWYDLGSTVTLLASVAFTYKAFIK
eukprot:m.57432 g.57432  ORF g.57432 m.57432 type:complete len:310 (+) comp11108_c0_seq1:329-1258(+)